MKLNYKLQGSGSAIVFLHGVFGSLDNLNMLAKDLQSNYQTIQVDMRNHGLSPWSDEMTLPSMADDIAELCHDLCLQNVIFIGHSMGGKVALQLTQVIPDVIKQIVAIDIAPVKYPVSSNALVLKALAQCLAQNITDKKQIIDLMTVTGLTEPTIMFLLKSFKNGHWLFNADVIVKQYANLCDWQWISPWAKPTLFIKGGNSDYISEADYKEILQQFPQAKIETVAGAGHNVHAEKTIQVLQILHHFLNNQG
ncbi:hypothetical protein A9G13_03360 [Gilliamella sp. wkB178]|uniref:alpha/beta fold hydrolase n=1 Tax=Gilliamella sp. wkB178 TaxID=3120259 RepID=UPI00080E022B|nr:alpha/beta fold hydrolase [Gilliamella apicola]OCG09103.1 hypothetical protein A9G13_03360 [Gilliamella apicola]